MCPAITLAHGASLCTRSGPRLDPYVTAGGRRLHLRVPGEGGRSLGHGHWRARPPGPTPVPLATRVAVEMGSAGSEGAPRATVQEQG